MALDLCRPLKLECPQEGGTQLDFGPTELNPLQDAMPAAGIYLQDTSATVVDQVALVDRTGTNLRFTDGITSHVLKELLSSSSGQVGSHNALLDVIHFLPEGPGDGWASGAVKQQVMSGPLLASATWYTNSAVTKKIVSLAYTYAGPLLATTKLTLYATDGSTIVRTVTDTFTYSGPLQTGCTRTWS